LQAGIFLPNFAKNGRQKNRAIMAFLTKNRKRQECKSCRFFAFWVREKNGMWNG
jgi:ribosomal protein L37AE/L43A